MSISLNIAIATDAWAQQSNGVVRTIGRTMDELIAAGHRPTILSPQSISRPQSRWGWPQGAIA